MIIEVFKLILGIKPKPIDKEIPDFSNIKIGNNFSEYYKEIILPFLEEKEKTRLSFLRRLRIINLIILILLIIFNLYIIQLHINSDDFIQSYHFFSICLYLVLFIAINSFFNHKYSSGIKTTLIPMILKNIGDFKYQRHIDLHPKEISEHYIFPIHNQLDAKDFIQGNYKGVDISLFNLRLKNISESEGRYRDMITFNGMVVIIAMDREFTGHTILLPKFVKSTIPFFNKFQSVTLEDPRFNKNFKVLSSDQIEARYILTTGFMERLLSLTKYLKSVDKDISQPFSLKKLDIFLNRNLFSPNNISCSFLNNEMLLLAPFDKEFFSVGNIFTPINRSSLIYNFLKELESIFEIIDILKLNTRIYK